MQESSYSKIMWFKDSYLSINENLKILEIGSLDKYGYYNSRDIFNHPNWVYEGLDIKEGNNVDIVVEDIYNLKEIYSDSYDIIISNFLFEHLQFFWKTMGEIKRVIKPGGYICIIVPSDGPKHGDMPVYNTFQIDDLIKLIRYFDFEIIHSSIDEENKPWSNICIVAFNNVHNDELELKLDKLETKVNSFLNFKHMLNNFDCEK